MPVRINRAFRIYRLVVYAMCAVSAAAMIAAALGFQVFASNIDNSKRSEVAGCYYFGADLAARVDERGVIEIGGRGLSYSVVSEKGRLALLPSALLRARPAANQTWHIVPVPGYPEMIPYQARNRGAVLTLTISDNRTLLAYRATCPLEPQRPRSAGSISSGAGPTSIARAGDAYDSVH